MTIARVRRHDDGGFALLIVLWSVAVLALVTGTLLSGARVEMRLAANRRGAAVASTAADAAISAAILDLLRAEGTTAARRRMGQADVAIRLENLSGRINPNLASAAMLNALLQSLGMAAQPAERLAAAIVDWRTPGLSPSAHGAKAAAYQGANLPYGPPGRPFEHLDELGAVLGMTPAVLAAMTPHLTLWSTSDPDPAFASAPVLVALRAAGAPPVPARSTEAQVIAITAAASVPDAPLVTRRAVVRFGYSPDGRGWRILAWDDASADSG